MGSSAKPDDHNPASPAFIAAYKQAAAPGSTLRFDAFMELALYHPELGYYRRNRARVGRDKGSDFYTATSLGPVFGELVAAACAKILASAGLNPALHTFVEIGAEPAGGVLREGVPHPFAAVRALRIGEPLRLEGPCVVFSNELFDARPVRRFIRRRDGWHELGVVLDGDRLHDSDLGLVCENADTAWLPPAANAPEGYLFDAPRAAADLASSLAGQPWHGLFVAFDYGKSYDALAQETPQGTMRAYHLQKQHNDLLARPGEQDLTAHVCWDWLSAALAEGGCREPRLESQESFFVHQAGDWIAGRLAREAAGSSPLKRILTHLLHPAQMGQKFQVLHALKTA